MADHFIDMLVDETLRSFDGGTGNMTFERRRALSRLPVILLAGSLPTPGIVRLNFEGTLLDMPRNFGPAKMMDSRGRVVTSAQFPSFFTALAPLLGVVDRLFLVEECGQPWFILWDSRAGDVTREVRQVFLPPAPTLCRKAS